MQLYTSAVSGTVSHDVHQKHVTIEEDNINLSCMTEHLSLLCTQTWSPNLQANTEQSQNVKQSVGQLVCNCVKRSRRHQCMYKMSWKLTCIYKKTVLLTQRKCNECTNLAEGCVWPILVLDNNPPTVCTIYTF